MSTRSPSSSSLSLGLKVFLLSALLVILAVGGSVLVTGALGDGVARRAVEGDLDRATTVQSYFSEFRMDQLFLRASTVSNDPNFIAYVVQALADEDPTSVLDQLDERQRDLGFDFAIVLDPDAQSLARTDLRSADRDLSQIPLVRDAIDSEEYSSLGIWARDDTLYTSVLVPLVKSGVLEGYLLAAYQITDTYAWDLRQMTGTEVVFLVNGADGAADAVAATTLDPAESADLVEWLKSADVNETPGTLKLKRRNYLVTGGPILDPLGHPVGRVVNLGSLDDALAPFKRIANILALVGLVAALLALPASFFLVRKLLLPVRRLAAAAEAAARGDLDADIEGLERGDEVGRLAGSFANLLSALRETRDMQVYLTELTRTLPDQEKSSVESEPAQMRFPTLVGLELRGYADGTDSLAPRETLERLTRDVRRITRATLAHGGSVESISGHRLLLCFDGDRHAERALSNVAEMLSMRESLPMALAMSTGAAITGTITWQQKPTKALTGSAVQELESLLKACRPGSLLMAKSAYVQLATLLKDLGVAAHGHKVDWATEAVYTFAETDLKKLAVPEARATMELTSTSVSGTTTTPLNVTLTNIGPGNVLGHRFEILSELGAGGMGVVFKARDQELNELVALKMLKQDAFAGEGLERLKDELKLARKISHPNVLRTFDFGDADGFPFISMEFVRGVTLKHLLEQSGRLPLSAGLHMARQLCHGLRAAHEQKVLHRDIKPENMIIEPTGNVKLMDFGIAQPIRRVKGEETSDNPVIGTPYYLAPEQLEGKEPDERADIYACGVVFYEIFTGGLPFKAGNNLMQIITQKMNEDPVPVSQVQKDVPKDLEAVIMRCLARDRNARYAHVTALLTDLEGLRR